MLFDGHWTPYNGPGSDTSFIVDPQSRWDKQKLVPIDNSLPKKSKKSKLKQFKKPKWVGNSYVNGGIKGDMGTS